MWEIRETNKEPEQMGPTEYEYVFYTVIADNQSGNLSIILCFITKSPAEYL